MIFMTIYIFLFLPMIVFIYYVWVTMNIIRKLKERWFQHNFYNSVKKFDANISYPFLQALAIVSVFCTDEYRLAVDRIHRSHF